MSIILQRATKPSLRLVASAIREQTGHMGLIKIVSCRMLPVQYEYPYWEFKYELED